jgi:Protein of unknown function (DUF3551)
MILAVETILAAAPAQAQTYDPNYPVCVQVSRIEGSYITCGYTSMAQCQMSASGLPAQCLTNPYFAPAFRRSHGRVHALKHH